MLRLRGRKQELLGCIVLVVSLVAPLLFLRSFNVAMPESKNDLLPRWVGVRAALARVSPYSRKVDRAIQIAYYGTPLPPGSHADEQRFAYPGHAVLFLSPLALMPMEVARWVFRVAAVALSVLGVFLWMKFCQVELAPGRFAFAAALVLCSWPVMWGLRQLNITLLLGPLAAAACYWFAKDRYVASGVAASILTIKPQLFVGLLAWLVVWSLLHRRWRFLLSLAASGAVMAAASEWLIPGWISQWLVAAKAYSQYAKLRPLLNWYLPVWAGYLLTAALGLAAVYQLWTARKCRAHDAAFAQSCAIAMAANLVLFPTSFTMIYNQILLIPSLLLMVGNGRPARGLLARLGYAVSFHAMTAAKLAIAAIAIGSLFAPPAIPIYSIPFFLAVTPIAILIYWLAAPRAERAESPHLERAAPSFFY